MDNSCSRAPFDDLQSSTLRSSALYAVLTPVRSMLRYHSSDTRSFTEGYEGNLTPAEEAALAELHKAAEGLDLRFVRGDYGQNFDGGDHAVEPLRLCLLRFLRGNSFNIIKALTQLQECVDHRQKHPTDKLLAKSPREILECDVEEYNSFYPRWLMGYDRLGRPIITTRYGSLRLWEMSKLTNLERMTEVHVREQELLLRVLRRRTAEGIVGRDDGREGLTEGERDVGYIVDTAVVIIDTAGLTLRHVTKDFVRLFKMRAHLDQLLFPEMLGKCFIVNTPSLFSYVWSMFSPFVHPRTREKISIIARPQDWKAALREIADADQISPEFGGTGACQEDLPSLADALYAAGSRCTPRSVGEEITQPLASSPARPVVTSLHASSTVAERRKVLPRFAVGPGDEEEAKEEEEKVESSNPSGGRWFGGIPGISFSWWGGEDDNGTKQGRDREASNTTNGEEFFDALAELDESDYDKDSSPPAEARHLPIHLRPPTRNGIGGDGAELHHDYTEVGCEASPSTDPPKVIWRRSWRGLSGSFVDIGTQSRGERSKGSSIGVEGSVRRDEGSKNRAARASCAALDWCCRPILRRLQQRSVEQLASWLSMASAVSALLAMALIVAAAFSLSTSWLGAVLGWQWGAIIAVCLGSLLLLLTLLGTVGARLRNRFSLLAFTVLEGAVAFGMLLSGIWCLALASGSATISDLTWEAIEEERNMSETKEEFLSEARNRLVVLGGSSLALSLFSVVGPCLLASALSVKIGRLEDSGPQRDNDKFEQLRRSFHETNALCTVFACACTGYGGYGLSFTIAIGLAANVTSTYLMVAGGYALLLAGAVGVWAAVSARPEAFRIHFGALVPAGALYASLCVIQLVRAGSSNDRVEKAWSGLHVGGESLYIIQAKVRTMLIVCGVLSAATTMLIAAAAVASWATWNALLEPGRGKKHRRVRLTRGEKLVACWTLALAVTSTFLDGSFAIFSAWLARDEEQTVWLAAFWNAMGRGDRRYVEGDTFVVASAVIVAAVIGPGALLYAWTVYCRKGYRFSVGILVCAASIQMQVLRYATQAGSGDSTSSSGSKAVFLVASVVLALLQVAGALVVLVYNIRRMAKRVHAAEVQYRALLLEHDRLALEGVDEFRGGKEEGAKHGQTLQRGEGVGVSRNEGTHTRRSRFR